VSLTAEQVYARATTALSQAPSVQVTGQTDSAQPPSTDFVLHFQGKDSAASLRIGAEDVEVRIVDETRYIETNGAVWSDLGLSSYAPRFANRWLEFPPGTATLLGGFQTLTSSLLAWGGRIDAARIIFAGFTPTGRPAMVSVDGLACYALSSPTGQRLFVNESDFRPVSYVGAPPKLDTTHFTYSKQSNGPEAPASPTLLPRAPRVVG